MPRYSPTRTRQVSRSSKPARAFLQKRLSAWRAIRAASSCDTTQLAELRTSVRGRGLFRRHYAGRSSIETEVAASPAADCRSVRVITSGTGPTVVRRRCRISRCSVAATTARSTRRAIRWTATLASPAAGYGANRPRRDAASAELRTRTSHRRADLKARLVRKVPRPRLRDRRPASTGRLSGTHQRNRHVLIVRPARGAHGAIGVAVRPRSRSAARAAQRRREAGGQYSGSPRIRMRRAPSDPRTTRGAIVLTLRPRSRANASLADVASAKSIRFPIVGVRREVW